MANLPKHTHPIDTDFFKDAIAKADLTQNEVASRLGLDKGAMSLMIHGKRKMTMAEAVALADMLNLDVHKVLARALGVPPKKARKA